MVDLVTAPGVQQWTVRVKGSDRFLVTWELRELRAQVWAIRKATVTDPQGVFAPRVIFQSDALIGSVASVVTPGGTPPGDPYIGLSHNAPRQSPVLSETRLDGVLASGDRAGAGVGFNRQRHSFMALDADTQAGEYEVHYHFNEDRLRVETRWDYANGMEMGQVYGAMAVASALTSGAMREWQIEGKPKATAVHDDALHYSGESHTPGYCHFTSPEHRFRLEATLPTGSGRLLDTAGQPGPPHWSYASNQRGFVQDTSNPNGDVKFYSAFNTTPRPAQSSTHLLDLTVTMGD